MMAEFQSILPWSNSTPWEKSVEQASGERWSELDIDIIRRAKRPWECPPHLLNFLAYELSVDIWNEDWPELKKRAVIASALADHRLKGTLAGTRRYLEIADAELKQAVTPPQFFVVSPGMTKDEWDEYLSKHPKVRIPLAETTMEWQPPAGFVLGHAALDNDAFGVDLGRWLRGRKAYLVAADGEQTPLQLAQIETETETRIAVEHYQIVTPGRGVSYPALGEFTLGYSVLNGWDIPTRWYSFSLDREYVHETSELAITTVPVGFSPRDTRYVRESETGDASIYLALGHDALDNSCLGRDGRGGELLADVIRLHDPEVAVPISQSLAFLGHSRIGMQHHTAEMLVDIRQTLPLGAAFVIGSSLLGSDPVVPQDTARRDFLLDAVAASKRGSDRIYVSFETTRERTLTEGIPLDSSIRLGEPMPNTL